MKLEPIKLNEFLSITLTATLFVLVARSLVNNTDVDNWVQEAWVAGQRTTENLMDNLQFNFGTSTNSPAAQRSSDRFYGTPDAIQVANNSVVMLSGNQSIGSGIILTSDGLVLTNSHVLRNGGDRWTVRFANEQELPAKVVASGSRSTGIFYDLALLQIEGATNLPVARFSEAEPQAGEPVWAIGAPYGRAEVVTQGEVKKLTRDGILLTNTEVHPGNSGGPLLNQFGEVIGINTEINPSLPSDATTASISVPVLEKYLPQLLN